MKKKKKGKRKRKGKIRKTMLDAVVPACEKGEQWERPLARIGDGCAISACDKSEQWERPLAQRGDGCAISACEKERVVKNSQPFGYEHERV